MSNLSFSSGRISGCDTNAIFVLSEMIMIQLGLPNCDLDYNFIIFVFGKDALN